MEPEQPVVEIQQEREVPPDEAIRGWLAAAKYVGRSDRWIRDLHQAGKLPGTKAEDGVYEFSRADLDAIREEILVNAAQNPHTIVPPRPQVVPPGVTPPQAAAPQTTQAAAPQTTQAAVPQVLQSPFYKGKVAPSTAKTIPLAQIVGDPHRVKMWKRNERNGNREFIRTYTYNDLRRSQDVETFVQQYLVPYYGPGEFEADMVDQDNKVLRTVSVPIQGPPGQPPPFGSNGAAPPGDSAVAVLTRQLADLTARVAQPPPTLQDKLAEMEALKKFGGGDSGALLMLLSNRGPDPMLMAMIQDLKTQIARLQDEASRPMMQPFTPMPPMPAESPVDIAKIITTALEAARPKEPPVTIASLLPTILDAIKVLRPPEEKKESFGIKDAIGLIPLLTGFLEKFSGKEHLEALLGELADLRKEQQKSPIRDYLDNIRAIQEVSRESSFQEESSFDFFLARVGGVVDKVRDLVRESRAGGAAAGEVEKKKALGGKTAAKPKPDPAHAAARVAVRRMAAAKTEGERVKTTLDAFRLMVQDPRFAKWGQRVRDLAKGKKKADLLDLFSEFIKVLNLGVATRGILSDEDASTIFAACQKNIDKIIAILAK